MRTVSMLIEVIFVGMLAGFVQGLSGFAFGLVATSLWAWVMAPQMLVPMVVMGSLIGQLTSIHGVRSEVRVERVAPFLLGGAVGVPLGALILHAMNVTAFRISVGLGLVIYCTVMLRAKSLPRVAVGGRFADCGVGFVAGVMGGASGLAGPPITLWCSLRGWAGSTQRATFQTFFIGTQILTLAIFAIQGLIDARLLLLFASVAPAIIASSWTGSRLAMRRTDSQFQKLLFLLLLASGVMLLLPFALNYVNGSWIRSV